MKEFYSDILPLTIVHWAAFASIGSLEDFFASHDSLGF